MPKHPEPPRAATLAAVLARALPDATPHRIALAVGAMTRAAIAHRRWSETECSYPVTDAQAGRAEKRLSRLALEAFDALRVAANGDNLRSFCIAKLAVTVNTAAGPAPDGPLTLRDITLKFGGDPRGCCGWLIVSDMPGDGWGDGYGIFA